MSRVNDFMVRTRNRLVRELRQHTGHSEGEATRLVTKILEILCHESGGADVYIPLRPGPDVAAVLRDLEQFSVRAVARRHRLSKSAVQRIKNRASGSAQARKGPSAGLSTGTPSGGNRP